MLVQINSYKTERDKGHQYPLSFEFIARDATTLNDNYLQVPPNAKWEEGIVPVGYRLHDGKNILIPSPEKDRANDVYDLYCGEILLGLILFFPLMHKLLNPDPFKNEINVNVEGKF